MSCFDWDSKGSFQPEEVMQRRIMLICVWIMPRPPATAAGSRRQCQRKSILVQRGMGCRAPNWLQDTCTYHVYILCLCAPCHLLRRTNKRNRLINSARCLSSSQDWMLHGHCLRNILLLGVGDDHCLSNKCTVHFVVGFR